ncbi:hypothetical protein PM082_008565 [Marasmius tenuissimus]|nr:hypothetical protein PM082_008565 [Marasmius tenuissimus]
MARTFTKLAVRYVESQKNDFIKGRTTLYNIPDKLSEGLWLAQTADRGVILTTDDGDENWIDIDEPVLLTEFDKAEEIADLEVEDNDDME